MCPSKAAPMEVPLGRTWTLNWGSARVSFLARDGGSDSGVDLLEPGGLMALRLPNDSALFGNWEIPDLDLWAVPDIDNRLDHIHRHLSIHHIEYPPQYPKYKKKVYMSSLGSFDSRLENTLAFLLETEVATHRHKVKIAL